MQRLGLVTLCLLGSVGCATLPAEVQDDMNAVIGVTDAWTKAITANDVDALMVLYSEDFKDDEGNTKADFREFITDTIGQGILTNVEVSTEYAELVIEDDTAAYNNIDLNSDVGAITVDLTLGREGSGWSVVSMLAR